MFTVKRGSEVYAEVRNGWRHCGYITLTEILWTFHCRFINRLHETEANIFCDFVQVFRTAQKDLKAAQLRLNRRLLYIDQQSDLITRSLWTTMRPRAGQTWRTTARLVTSSAVTSQFSWTEKYPMLQSRLVVLQPFWPKLGQKRKKDTKLKWKQRLERQEIWPRSNPCNALSITLRKQQWT